MSRRPLMSEPKMDELSHTGIRQIALKALPRISRATPCALGRSPTICGSAGRRAVDRCTDLAALRRHNVR